MAANITPRFTGRGDFQPGVVCTAVNTTKDGASGTIYTVYTAPTDGGFVEGIILVPVGTNIPTVIRLFMSTGVTTVAANNSYIGALTLPATTNSETAALVQMNFPIPRALRDVPAGYKFFMTLGTGIASGWMATASAQRWAL